MTRSSSCRNTPFHALFIVLLLTSASLSSAEWIMGGSQRLSGSSFSRIREHRGTTSTRRILRNVSLLRGGGTGSWDRYPRTPATPKRPPGQTSTSFFPSQQQQQQQQPSSTEDEQATKDMIDAFLTRDSRNSFIGTRLESNLINVILSSGDFIPSMML